MPIERETMPASIDDLCVTHPPPMIEDNHRHVASNGHNESGIRVVCHINRVSGEVVLLLPPPQIKTLSVKKSAMPDTSQGPIRGKDPFKPLQVFAFAGRTMCRANPLRSDLLIGEAPVKLLRVLPGF